MYELELMPEARDDLASLDKPIAQRIFNKLHWLAENFDAMTPEPLTGEWKGLFKLRIGSIERFTLSTGPNGDSPSTSSSIGVRPMRRSRHRLSHDRLPGELREMETLKHCGA